MPTPSVRVSARPDEGDAEQPGDDQARADHDVRAERRARQCHGGDRDQGDAGAAGERVGAAEVGDLVARHEQHDVRRVQRRRQSPRTRRSASRPARRSPPTTMRTVPSTSVEVQISANPTSRSSAACAIAFQPACSTAAASTTTTTSGPGSRCTGSCRCCRVDWPPCCSPSRRTSHRRSPRHAPARRRWLRWPTPLARAGDEAETVTSYLAGSLRQRRTGLGWRSMQSLPDARRRVVADRRRGARRVRRDLLAGRPGLAGGPRRRRRPTLFGRATADEQRWLRGLVTGEVRQGALDSLVQEALAVGRWRPARPRCAGRR